MQGDFDNNGKIGRRVKIDFHEYFLKRHIFAISIWYAYEKSAIMLIMKGEIIG